MAATKSRKPTKKAPKSNKKKAIRVKTASSRPSGRTKPAAQSVRHTGKPAKTAKTVKKTAPKAVSSQTRTKAKPAGKPAVRRVAGPVRPRPSDKTPAPSKALRPSTFAAALKLYESGVKLMHSEKFDRAKAVFEELIAGHPDETELLDRANVLIQVCSKRLPEARKPPRLRGADEYYDVGVAEMNRRALDAAFEHLHHALKLAPKGAHILYALATASALAGRRDDALDYLRKSIQFREENRFLANNDEDFESVVQDPEFQKLITS